MPEFAVLERAMQRSIVLASSVCVALLGITIASLSYAFMAGNSLREAGARAPVLVVPGAVGGIYSPGLTEQNLRDTARYLTSLATNFGSARSFHERFDELETFCAPTFLPALQSARQRLERDVESQNQARSFFAAPGSERFRQTRPGHFAYAVRGERTVFSSGLPMDNRASEARLYLQWGAPSQRNRSGVFLEGFEITDLGEGGAAATLEAAPDAS